MRSITDCSLYGILDLGYVSSPRALETAELMLRGGIDVIQLRAKHIPERDIRSLAENLHPLTAASGVPLIINDHPAVAAEAGVEGVHVGQDDLAVADTRKRVPAGCLVGKSTHSPRQAETAARDGADYIGFGPLFATPTKPDYTAIGLQDIRWVRENVPLPVFCIGGIKLENLQRVIDAGATRVVIVSGILQAEDIPRYIRDVKNLLPPAS